MRVGKPICTWVGVPRYVRVAECNVDLSGNQVNGSGTAQSNEQQTGNITVKQRQDEN